MTSAESFEQPKRLCSERSTVSDSSMPRAA
jgi:hypothetical protein